MGQVNSRRTSMIFGVCVAAVIVWTIGIGVRMATVQRAIHAPLPPALRGDEAREQFLLDFDRVFHPLADVDGWRVDAYRVITKPIGRWASLTFAPTDVEAARDAGGVRDTVSEFVASHGWERAGRPRSLNEIYRRFPVEPSMLGADDVAWTHKPSPMQPATMFNACRLHVSADASSIVFCVEMRSR
jgi:hypothetical protein